MSASAPLALLRREDFGGFWIRTAAGLIDLLVLLLPVELLGIWLRTELLGTEDPKAAGANLYGAIAVCAIWIPYWILLWSSPWQATIGKRILGLRIVGEGGERIGLGRAAGRAVAVTILGNLLIGVLAIPFTSRRQGLHDMLARTYVVKRQAWQSNNVLERSREG